MSITNVVDFVLSDVSTVATPKVTVAVDFSNSATSFITSTELKQSDGTSISGFAIIGVKSSDGFVEEMYLEAGDISGTTITPTTRGIKKGGLDVTTSDSNLKPSVTKAGSEVFLVVSGITLNQMQQALLGTIGSTYKLNARPTYSGTDAVHSDRVFADATARDAAITSPANGDRCYNTADGVFQKYQAGAWVDEASGATPNASETVAGKVELATTAESQDGTDTGGTGASLSVLPSDIAANVQDSVYSFAADAEANDTYAITLAPAPSAYATGQSFYFSANTANTGAATLNVNALGAKTIKKFHDQDLEDNDIESGSVVHVVYDGTNFQLQTPVATTMSSADSALLTGGANADSLHTHNNLLLVTDFDSRSRTGNAADTTETVTHNLGRVPKMIEIRGQFERLQNVQGAWVSGKQKCIAIESDPTAGTGDLTSGTDAIVFGSTTNNMIGTIQNVTSTEFEIDWVKTGTGAGSFQMFYIWSAIS